MAVNEFRLNKAKELIDFFLLESVTALGESCALSWDSFFLGTDTMSSCVCQYKVELSTLLV